MRKFDEEVRQTAARKVMQQIKSGKVTMRPHWQFALATALSIAALATVAILTVYLTNLVVFKLRLASGDRPMFGLRATLDYFTDRFPWVAFGFGIVSIGLLVWVVRKFDFSYHLGRWLLVVIVTLSLATGTAVAFTNLNSHLETFGPMHGIYGPQAQGGRAHGGAAGTPQHNNDHMGPSEQNGNDMTQRRGQQHE